METLKINQQTVRNMIDRGELRAVRIGQRRVRVRRSDLEHFITSGEAKARARPAQLRTTTRRRWSARRARTLPTTAR